MAAPRTLLAPVSHEIAALIESLAPVRAAGGSFSAGAVRELAEDLARWACHARLAEVLGNVEEFGSGLLFALAGALEKFSGTGCAVTQAEAAVLTDALRAVLAAVEGLEEALARDLASRTVAA
jgi:hypothetical protein